MRTETTVEKLKLHGDFFMYLEIRSRLEPNKILYSGEAESLLKLIEKAVLAHADLAGANLVDANLVGANLMPIREDFWLILSASPAEVPALRAAIIAGKINGSTYEGDCPCLVSTIAKARRCGYKEMPDLPPNPNRPAERFFLAIKPGDTPNNSQFAKLAVEWIDALARIGDFL